MKMRKEHIGKSSDYTAAWGNENIIRNHIAYFENKLEEEIAQFKEIKIQVSLAHYPNFAVWLRLKTELICNKLFYDLHRVIGDWSKIIRFKFDEIIKKIEEVYEGNPDLLNKSIYKFKDMKKAIFLVLELRHSFQHGGLPNILREFKYDIDEEIFKEMLNPNNYKKTKEIFSQAEHFAKLLPKTTIVFIDDNHISIYKKIVKK